MKKVKIRSTSGEYVLAIRLPSEYNYNSSPRPRPRDKENNPVIAKRINEVNPRLENQGPIGNRSTALENQRGTSPIGDSLESLPKDRKHDTKVRKNE